MTSIANGFKKLRAPRAGRNSHNTSRMSPRRGLYFCLAALVAFALVGIFAPHLTPYDPFDPDPSDMLAAPGAQHWMGTDELGRDVFSRIIYGTRTALVAAFMSTAIGVAGGVVLGTVAGYFGGWIDRVIMRCADLAQAIPALLLAMALVAGMGPGIFKMMLAVGVVFIDSVLRLTRAKVLAEREKVYVEAAMVAGMSNRHIMWRQIFPNVVSQIIVFSSVLCGVALLIEGALSFVGIGEEPGWVSWGAMLSSADEFSMSQPILPIFPGVALACAVLLFNGLGSCLRSLYGEATDRGVVKVKSGKTEVARVATAQNPPPGDEASLLRVENLTVSTVDANGERMDLVSSAGFGIEAGEVYGLVGESGSGKSLTAMAILGLLPGSTRVSAGSISLEGKELTGLAADEWRDVRGRRIGAVFQDPVGSLSPVHTIGQQLIDAVRAHDGGQRRQATERSVELLSLVGVPDPRKRMEDYPHQFSGGMAQRVGIALALAGEPSLLIADEPTTALDVTTQKQVLTELTNLSQTLDMSVLLITHDLGAIAEFCTNMSVMYAGQIVESGSVVDIFEHPRHPYTEALMSSAHSRELKSGRRSVIPGEVPAPWAWPVGCRYEPRCPYGTSECKVGPVKLELGSRCLRSSELALSGTSAAHE